MDCIINWVDIS